LLTVALSTITISHSRWRVLDISLPVCDSVCQWLVAGRWFSPDSSLSSADLKQLDRTSQLTITTFVSTCWFVVCRLFVEESAVHVPGENHQPAASHWQT
jgi:hypothetical protein